MSAWEERSLVDDLLTRGLDDWIYDAEVYSIAMRSGLSDPVRLRELSIGLIVEVLISGLMVAGEYDGSTFRRWECSTNDAIVRLSLIHI